MRLDRLHCLAAYPNAHRTIQTRASIWLEGPEGEAQTSLPNPYTLQELAGVAILRRPAYPVVEF